ncbi:MAG: hypothetical protein AAFR65_02175 [Pseudomonadota bacterium]
MTEQRTPDTEAMLKAHREGTEPQNEAEKRERAFIAGVAAAKPEDEPISDFAWARLQRSIRQEKPQAAAPWWRQAQVAPWQLAASVAAALALGQLTMVSQVASDETKPTYQTASAPISLPTITVAFVPSVTEESIRMLLLEQSAEIVAGPSAIGLYSIRPTGEAELEDIAAALRDAEDLVESVQVD